MSLGLNFWGYKTQQGTLACRRQLFLPQKPLLVYSPSSKGRAFKGFSYPGWHSNICSGLI